jgi:hypothetical protein
MGLSEISHNHACKVRDQLYAVTRAVGTAAPRLGGASCLPVE